MSGLKAVDTAGVRVAGDVGANACDEIRSGQRRHEQSVAGTRPERRRSIEGVVQVVIMLAIGAAAGAASFTHVHDVAAGHGQAGWLAWADAVVRELMSVASGLEIRRRKRVHGPVAFPVVVLTVAVSLSLSAQVVDAEASPIGWITAAIPALGFLVMVKIALAQAPGPSRVAEVLAPIPRQAADGAAAGRDVVGSANASGGSEVGVLRDVPTLMPAARAAVAVLDGQGRRVSRRLWPRLFESTDMRCRTPWPPPC